MTILGKYVPACFVCGFVRYRAAPPTPTILQPLLITTSIKMRCRAADRRSKMKSRHKRAAILGRHGNMMQLQPREKLRESWTVVSHKETFSQRQNLFLSANNFFYKSTEGFVFVVCPFRSLHPFVSLCLNRP